MIRLLLFAGAANIFVLHSVRVAVAWLALREAHSSDLVWIVSAAVAAEALARPLLAPLADAFDRVAVLRSGMGAGFVALLGLFFASKAAFNPFACAGFLVLLSLSAALCQPAAGALVSDLAPASQLDRALAQRGVLGALAALVGPACAMALIGHGGASWALAGAAIVGGCATSGVGRLRAPSAKRKQPRPATFMRAWPVELGSGFRALWHTSAELRTGFVAAFLNAATVALLTVAVPVWAPFLPWQMPIALRIGLIEAAIGIGMALGGMSLLRPLNRLLGRHDANGVGLFCAGMALLSTSRCEADVLSTLCCFVVAGAGSAVFLVNTNVVRAQAVPERFRARMLAAQAFLATIFAPGGVWLVNWVIEARGDPGIGAAACGALVLAPFGIHCVNTDARRIGHPLAVEGEAYGRIYPRAFSM